MNTIIHVCIFKIVLWYLMSFCCFCYHDANAFFHLFSGSGLLLGNIHYYIHPPFFWLVGGNFEVLLRE